jgi:hypothetical protein
VSHVENKKEVISMDDSVVQGVAIRFIVALAIIAVAGPWFTHAADRALIVGVGDYADPQVSDLPGIDLDVDMMLEVAERLGFQSDQIKTLTNQEATYSGFKRAFEQWLINGTQAHDRVLLYFSGHGTRVPDDNGDEDDESDEALVLHDTRVVQGVQGPGLERMLRDDEFSTLLQQIPSRHVLVLVDACHSGTAYKSINLSTRGNMSLGEPVAYPKFFSYPGMPSGSANEVDVAVIDKDIGVQLKAQNYVYLAAAADDEKALATPKGSVFTLGVQSIITTAASQQDALTLQGLHTEVARYIENKVTSEGLGNVHRPQWGGNPSLWTQRLRLVTARQGGRIWQQLENLVAQGEVLTITANKPTYRLQEEVSFQIVVPRAGYLNVVNVGPRDDATVLFPNQYHRDNRVQEGTLRLPTDQMPFYFPAKKPTGPTMTVAIWSKTKINLLEDAVEGRDKSGGFDAVLAPLSAKAMQSVGVAQRQQDDFAAGKVMFKVVE